MSIKSEPAPRATVYEAYLVGSPRYDEAVGGSLARAFSTTDDMTDFDALLRQLDAVPDVSETRN